MHVHELHRHISRKTVSFSISEIYSGIPFLLADSPSEDSANHSPLCGEKSRSPVWCLLVDYLRTQFTQSPVSLKAKSDLPGVPRTLPGSWEGSQLQNVPCLQ